MIFLEVTYLDHWCDCISDIKASFFSLSFQHIYRKHNSSANGLSKEALSLDTRKISFIEYLEGEVIGFGNLKFILFTLYDDGLLIFL